MSNWIVRCAKRRCGHVCDERQWIAKVTKDPRVRKTHCPKCDGTEFYQATPAEIERAKLPSSRIEAACAAE